MVSNADHRSIESEDDGPAAGLIAHALDCIFYSYKCRITDERFKSADRQKNNYFSILFRDNDCKRYLAMIFEGNDSFLSLSLSFLYTGTNE